MGTLNILLAKCFDKLELVISFMFLTFPCGPPHFVVASLDNNFVRVGIRRFLFRNTRMVTITLTTTWGAEL